MWFFNLMADIWIDYPDFLNRHIMPFLLWAVHFPAIGALLDAIDNSIKFLDPGSANASPMLFLLAVAATMLVYFYNKGIAKLSWRFYA